VSLCSFTCLLLRSVCGTGNSSNTADVTALFVNNQYGIQRRGQGFDKKTHKYTQHTQLRTYGNLKYESLQVGIF